jgi:hypothetical protein
VLVGLVLREPQRVQVAVVVVAVLALHFPLSPAPIYLREACPLTLAPRA